MPSKTRYRCTYCGVDDICPTLSPWELPSKRCKKCNHGKFKLKEMPESGNLYYDEEKAEELPWGDYGTD